MKTSEIILFTTLSLGLCSLPAREPTAAADKANFTIKGKKVEASKAASADMRIIFKNTEKYHLQLNEKDSYNKYIVNLAFLVRLKSDDQLYLPYAPNRHVYPGGGDYSPYAQEAFVQPLGECNFRSIDHPDVKEYVLVIQSITEKSGWHYQTFQAKDLPETESLKKLHKTFEIETISKLPSVAKLSKEDLVRIREFFTELQPDYLPDFDRDSKGE